MKKNYYKIKELDKIGSRMFVKRWGITYILEMLEELRLQRRYY